MADGLWIDPVTGARRFGPFVFQRADGCSGNGYACERCGCLWVDHIAPGCQCPTVPGSRAVDELFALWVGSAGPAGYVALRRWLPVPQPDLPHAGVWQEVDTGKPRFWSPELPEVEQVAIERTGSWGKAMGHVRTTVWLRIFPPVDIWTLRALSAFLLLLCLALPAGAQTLRGPARVVDGDTLEVAGEKVRLHGVDAPELAQTCLRAGGAAWHCGWAAALRLEEMIGGRPVLCEGGERDRYRRVIARCFVTGRDVGVRLDLGGALVVRGLATAYRRYSLDYASAEATARAARVGLWAGSFVPPAEWRKGVR